MVKKKFYITTAIDYVNARPHVGHAYEKVIADALARWHRLLGEDVFFLTGTDDNASKNAEAAEKAGMPVKEFVEQNTKFFIELCEQLNLSNDDFIRTSVDEYHIKIAQEVFKKVFDKKDIYKSHYEGLYCTGCETFYTEKDLINGECPEHKKKPELLKEESYFFKLSKYKDQILELIKKGLIMPKQWSNEIQSRLENEELKDISVSRVGKDWGLKTPIDEKHTIYVWFDALINYYSATRVKKREKYWPADVHFIGKGINWFHSVIWPGMLISAGIKVPKKVLVHGYLTIEGQKMSKSLGNVIDPVYLINTYGVDAVRYYLMREIPAGQDGDVSEKTIVERTNSDLANTLGNLLQRVTVLVSKNFDNIPAQGKLEEIDENLIKQSEIFDEVNDLMQRFEWHKALEKIWEFIHACNAYINAVEPWKIDDEKRLSTVLYNLVESLRIISLLTYSFIPESAEKIANQLGQEITSFKNVKFRKNTRGKISEPKILFQKLEQLIEKKSLLNLKVAQIESVEDHPDADKLYVLKLNVGSEKRQLVAGIKNSYSKTELIGKKIVLVSNLKPAKLRSVESQGMLLAADAGEKCKLLEPSGDVGSQVLVEGTIPNNDQIKYDDFVKLTIIVRDKKAFCDGKELKGVSINMPDGTKIR
ncbi:methionine--tRNA ligase [Candidatus Woesearchaeota archaeon CG10_big_fil_rev_8_21_14_0_10_30_7]|nr:MAG: methionine--tRNA ligase [Candidatus Woesearchaeota archaeon CG10_big_fil_rev_8_21_14_0_10_30_7]